MRTTFIFCALLICLKASSQNPVFAKDVMTTSPFKIPTVAYPMFMLNMEEIRCDPKLIKRYKIKSVLEHYRTPILSGNPGGTLQILFTEFGVPSHVKRGKNSYHTFQYDSNRNLEKYHSYYKSKFVGNRYRIRELIIDNEFDEQSRLVLQQIQKIDDIYKSKNNLIQSMSYTITHQIEYFNKDSTYVTSINNYDTISRMILIKDLFGVTHGQTACNDRLNLETKDTIISQRFGWRMCGFKKILTKEYDTLGYLIKMEAIQYKENSLVDTWVYSEDTTWVKYLFSYTDNYYYSNPKVLAGYTIYDIEDSTIGGPTIRIIASTNMTCAD